MSLYPPGLADKPFPIDRLQEFVERYPGLDELIEEFEHITMAKEDEDRQAIAYFKKECKLRELGEVTNQNDEDDPLFIRDTLDEEYGIKTSISNHL